MKIIQSWDDGIVDDIRVVEILRRYNATACFNLNIGLNRKQRMLSWKYQENEVWRLSLEEMPELYHGFEIASHSLTHPHLTRCSSQELRYEIEKSRSILQEMFSQPVDGFCYPFGDFNEAVKDALRAVGYRYARGVAKSDDCIPPHDLFEFNPHCHFLDSDFWELYERAKSRGSNYFFFWGHSYELVNEDMWRGFEQKITAISADPASEWANITELVCAEGHQSNLWHF